MKKIVLKMNLAFVILLIVGLAVAGCSPSSTPSDASEVYKIGAVVDISGNSSSLGIPERDTLEMMVAEINALGGVNGIPLELTILDNKSDETEAMLAAKDLIEDGVLAIIGCSASGTTMAMKNTIQFEEIPLISMAASSAIVEPVEDSKWVFKTAQSDILMIENIMSYLKENNLTDIAFLSMNNAYGDNGKLSIMATAEVNGINIVVEEKFGAEDKDMTPQLTKVKNSSAQAVVVWAIPPSASILTKNYRDLNITLPLIHSHGVGNQNFIDGAMGAADGVIVPIGKFAVADQIPDTDPQKAILQSYIASYTAKYNKNPNSFGGYAYDALSILVTALEKAGPDRGAIRDEIEKISGYVGISGTFNMGAEDHNGLDSDAVVMVTIEDGKWKLMQ